MCRKHGSQNQAARYINGSLFFRKCGTWMGVPVLIGTSMGHFLSLRYIDGPFFIIEVHRWAIFYHWYINLALFWYLHGWIFPTGTCMGGQKLYTVVHGWAWMGLTSYTVVHGWVTFPSKLVHGWVMGGGTSKFPEAHPYPDQSWVPPPDLLLI